MKRRLRFIVNPFSGTSSKEDFATLIKNNLDHSKFEYEISLTQKAGHAIALAKESVEEGIDITVAVGGDGSVNEVAQSLVGANTALGILPGGSGNGFAMHLGLGRNLKNAISHLNTGKLIEVDTCKVNGRFFINVAGLGFDARIAYLTKQNSKRGFLPYLSTAIKESRKFKPFPLSIEIDDKHIQGNYAAAVVANASMYGYHFSIAPIASMQDGILDVMLIKEAPVYQYFLNTYRFLNRTLHKSKLVEHYTGQRIKLTVNEDSYLHVDGEGLEVSGDLEFELLPKSLKVIAPSIKKSEWAL